MEIVDAHVALAGLDPFGEVLGGWVTLCGALECLDVVYVNEERRAVELRACRGNDNGALHIGDAWLDLDGDLSSMGPAEIGAPLSGLWALHVLYYLALVLGPVAHDSSRRLFKRLGFVVLRVDGLLWIAACEKANTII